MQILVKIGADDLSPVMPQDAGHCSADVHGERLRVCFFSMLLFCVSNVRLLL